MAKALHLALLTVIVVGSIVFLSGSVAGVQSDGNQTEASLNVSVSNENIGLDNLGKKTDIIVNNNSSSSLIVRSDNISSEILAEMVNGTVTAEGVQVPIPSNGRIQLYATWEYSCQVGTGDHVFVVEDPNTGVARTVEISATRYFSDLSFVRSRYRVVRGNSVQIPITVVDEEAVCWEPSNLSLFVTSDSTMFNASTSFRDINNDNIVIVTINTSSLTSGQELFNNNFSEDMLSESEIITGTHSTRMESGEYNLRVSTRELNNISHSTLVVETQNETSLRNHSSTLSTTYSVTDTQTMTESVTSTRTTNAISSTQYSRTIGSGVGFTIIDMLFVILPSVYLLTRLYEP